METKKVKITEEEKEMFYFLNDLRESGVTNMFGAGAYLVKQFGIDSQKARNVLTNWMQNFNEDGYEDLV